jgi:amidase
MAVINALGAGGLLKALNVVEPLAMKTFAFMPYTALFNVTGQPAMSVPLHWNAAGLPIGVQLAGRFADDMLLLRVARQLEAAQPWFSRVAQP